MITASSLRDQPPRAAFRATVILSAKVLAVTAVALIAFLFTGLIHITSMKGPMFFNDGKTHYITEVSFAGQIGYRFGGTSPDQPTGWYRPITLPWD